jgi:hypothetical protein
MLGEINALMWSREAAIVAIVIVLLVLAFWRPRQKRA